MKFRIPELDRLNRSEQDTLLAEIITHADRSYLKDTLAQFKIPNRTKIYNAGNISYRTYVEITKIHEWDSYCKSQQAEKDSLYKTILDRSSLNEWIDIYLHRFTLANLLYTITSFINNDVTVICEI
jgi:hypothetical protein